MHCNMVKWRFVIYYGSLLKFSDNLNDISKGMCIFKKYFVTPFRPLSGQYLRNKEEGSLVK